MVRATTVLGPASPFRAAISDRTLPEVFFRGPGGRNSRGHAGEPASDQRSRRNKRSICISSTGAPFTSMKAISTPALGLLGAMITF